MTLICGRVCTKGEGKERLVRKRKRRREVNEQLTHSVTSRGTGTGQGWNGWDMGSPRLSQHALRAPDAVSVPAQLSI